MRITRWQAGLAAGLVALAALFYAVRWWLFPAEALHDEMWRFLVGDLAFLFVQVLLVTLVIDNVMQRRAREEMLKKLNMAIGAFFSEAGTPVLGRLAASDTALPAVRERMTPAASWTAADYARSRAMIQGHEAQIDLSLLDLDDLRDEICKHRPFLLGLLGNQNLLEHESFTDLLWALTHLGEELSARADLTSLTAPDAAHLAGDVKRALTLLACEWVGYMRHLSADYPYLFSLAVRTNPLDPDARVNVS